jgi:hypothetical protein
MNTIMLRHTLVALTLVLGAAAPAPLHAAPTVPASEARFPETRLPLATNATNATNAPPVRAQAPVLVGGVLQDVIGNRSRLIQVSFIAILIGIFILWKK